MPMRLFICFFKKKKDDETNQIISKGWDLIRQTSELGIMELPLYGVNAGATSVCKYKYKYKCKPDKTGDCASDLYGVNVCAAAVQKSKHLSNKIATAPRSSIAINCGFIKRAQFNQTSRMAPSHPVPFTPRNLRPTCDQAFIMLKHVHSCLLTFMKIIIVTSY